MQLLIDPDTDLYGEPSKEDPVEVPTSGELMGLTTPEALTSPAPSGSGPVAVYMTEPHEPWCSTRRGVWWPQVGLWVDHLELTPDDVVPAGARTYPLVPDPGHELADVHGLLDQHGVAHVLVTGPTGDVITTASMADTTPEDRGLLVVATLVAAAGGSADPAAAFEACTPDRVVTELGSLDWKKGWSVDVYRALGRLIRVLTDLGV